MIQISTLQDTVSRPDSSAAGDASAVLKVKLDSALMAHIEVPAPATPSVEPRGPSPVVPVVLGVVLVGVLLLVRTMARGTSFVPAGRRERRPTLETPPSEVPPRASPPRTPRVPPRPAAQPPINLPPHVAALVARIEAKKEAAPQGSHEDPDEGQRVPLRPGQGGGGRLDVLIGG